MTFCTGVCFVAKSDQIPTHTIIAIGWNRNRLSMCANKSVSKWYLTWTHANAITVTVYFFCSTHHVRIYHETLPNWIRYAPDEPSCEPPAVWCRLRKSTSAPPPRWTWKSSLRRVRGSKTENAFTHQDMEKVFAWRKLPLYCGKSSLSSHADISKCGCRGRTIIGPICFLLNVENRKFHAIPEWREKMKPIKW